MRIDPGYVQDLVGALNQNVANEQQYSMEISTGVSVNSISDNPVAASQDFLLRSQQSVNDNFVQTASGASGAMQVMDTALGSVVSQITQAVTLATEGNNGTLNAGNLQSIANQLTGVRDEILSLANANYQGQYLFAGSKTATQPFSLDASTSPATVVYSGDAVQNTLKGPGGQSYTLNLPGNVIFGSGATGILSTLSNLIAEFSSGSASSASIADTNTLSADLQTVSQQRVILGNSLSALQSSNTYTQEQTTQLQAAEDTLIQTNPAETAAKLSSTTTQQAALMDMIATIDQQGTLFNILQ